MLTDKELLSLINSEINNYRYPTQSPSLYEPISYSMGLGGKRVRPLALLMAHQAYDDQIAKALPAALGIELFHNFTLLHDDIMDKADVRRGKPVVHRIYGENAAILSGDAMQILAYQALANVSSEHLKNALDCFSQTALEVCQGQQMDIEFEKRDDVSVDEYIEMIRLKTAVLLAASFKIGAILGGANEVEANALYEFGIAIGIAFQLRDDYLDVFGCQETFGKKIGGDILCNKKTYLLIHTLKYATKEDKQQMEKWIKKDEFEAEEKIHFFVGMYEKYQTKEKSLHLAETYFQKAMTSLDSLLSARKEPLELIKQLAYSLMDRQS